MVIEQTERPPVRVRPEPSAAAAPPRRARSRWVDRVVVAAILAGGLAVLALNLDLPIARNSFMYARASQNIVATGYRPLAVIADPSLSYGKPIAFPLLAVPLNQLLGPNRGMKVLSFLATALFALAAWLFFARVNVQLGIDPRLLPLEMVLLFGNPLMAYQFWSAYPDTLFAAEVLAAFLLTDRVARGRPEGAVLSPFVAAFLLGEVIYAAILTKLYALFLGLACPLYIAVHWHGSRPAWATIKTRVAALLVVFAILGAALVTARRGSNPTIDLGANGAHLHSPGVSEMEAGLGHLTPEVVLQEIGCWSVALIVTFGVSLLLLCWRGRAPIWPRAWTWFCAIFLLGLVPFGMDIVYNIRYVIPLFPFVVVAIAGGFRAAGRSPWRKWILAVHAGVAALLTLLYNVPRVYQALAPLRTTVLEPFLGKGERLDSLRIGQHLQLARQLARINQSVEPGGTLFWLNTYGVNATHGVIEDVIRRDVRVRYDSLRHASTDSSVYLAADIAFPQVSPPWEDHARHRFRPNSLGDGVVLLEPYLVLTSPRRNATFAPGDLVPLAARVPAWAVTPRTRVEFLVDGQVIAVDQDPPYQVSGVEAGSGRHHAAARIYAGSDEVVRTSSRPFFVGLQAIEQSVTDCRDDVEQVEGSTVIGDSSDLEMTRDPARGDQVVGLRFTDISVPAGARIKQAYLQFTADKSSADETALELRAELAGSAAGFATGRGPAVRRTGSAAVLWRPPAWDRVGERAGGQRTPDLSRLVQEVVAAPGWQAGGALAVVIRGSGARAARSCDGASAPGDEPSIYIEYETSGGLGPSVGRGAE